MAMTLRPSETERAEILLELAQRISRTFDLREILQHLLAAVRQVVPYDAAGVFVLNRSLRLPGLHPDRVIAAMATVGFFYDEGREDPMLRSGKGIIGHVIRTGAPVVEPDVRGNPYYVAGREGTLSEIAVPIASNGTVIGTLNLESDHLGFYSERDARELGYFAAVAAISIEKAVLHHQVMEKQHLDHHLALAREVQISLLPRSDPSIPGYEVHGINLPSMLIGGDYFDYLPFDDERMGLVVADVSGKGVAAALIMATFRAALRAEYRRSDTVAKVVECVSRLLLDSIDPSRYVTAVYGILDPPTGRFTYVNCGHVPPMLFGSDGRCAFLDRGRPALGMPFDADQDSGEVHLAPGDSLVIFTDGVTELFPPVGREFGLEGLEAMLRSMAGKSAFEVVQSVTQATLQYTGRNAYDDDFTLLVVRRR